MYAEQVEDMQEYNLRKSASRMFTFHGSEYNNDLLVSTTRPRTNEIILEDFRCFDKFFTRTINISILLSATV